MTRVEESIDLSVPVSTAYNQWTQFEEFPRFMEHVEEVQQLDDTHLRWRVNVAGRVEQFDAEVTEQTPDSRIAWSSTEGRRNAGAVDFHPLPDGGCHIAVVMDAESDGAVEAAADATGRVARQIRSDLERFKEMIEQRGEETGAWRGTVDRQAS